MRRRAPVPAAGGACDTGRAAGRAGGTAGPWHTRTHARTHVSVSARAHGGRATCATCTLAYTGDTVTVDGSCKTHARARTQTHMHTQRRCALRTVHARARGGARAWGRAYAERVAVLVAHRDPRVQCVSVHHVRRRRRRCRSAPARAGVARWRRALGTGRRGTCGGRSSRGTRTAPRPSGSSLPAAALCCRAPRDPHTVSRSARSAAWPARRVRAHGAPRHPAAAGTAVDNAVHQLLLGPRRQLIVGPGRPHARERQIRRRPRVPRTAAWP
jgi:hypothetical protein